MQGIGRQGTARGRWTGLLAAGPVLALLGALLLAGCEASLSDVTAREHERITEKVEALGRYIQDGRLAKGRLITHYAAQLDRTKPEHRELVAALRKEATVEGLAYGNIRRRIADVPREPGDDKEAQLALDSLSRIEAAADPEVFDDSLVDVVNVLAGLSDGALPAVEGAAGAPPPKGGAGSYLVGNPAYGQWRQNSSGSSFWEFYGQYALFRDLLGGGRGWSQDRWYRDRNWSYYGDQGRHYYGSRNDQKQWTDTARRNPDVQKKSFRSTSSARRLSTYGKATERRPAATAARAKSHSGFGASVRGTKRTSSWSRSGGK